MTLDASSAYRHTDGHGANPIKMVILLYEQLIKDLQRGLAAMERNDIEGRTDEIDHALRVVGQLQGTLDMQQGGEVAKNLDRYYYSLRVSLLNAQIGVLPGELRKHIRILLELREAWVQVERSTQKTGELLSPAAPMMPSSLEKTLRWSI
jgi:flagellar protein FliS